MTNIIELFTQLVQIDSISGEEKLLARFIKNYLSQEGIKFKTDRYGMIYVNIPGEGEPKLFCAHMDTVEPGRNIKVLQKDGYLISQGDTILGGDNKVALAAILLNLIKHKNDGQAMEILFTVREETDSGIKDMRKNWIKSKVGFVFDDGDGIIGWLALHAPTIEGVTITIKGVATHASTPEAGIDALKVWTKSGVGQYLGQPTPQTTFNVGLISGGTAVNTVIQELVLEGDMRSESVIELEITKKNVTKCLLKSAKKYGANIKIEWSPSAPGYTIDKKNIHLQRLKDVYKNEGMTLQLQKTAGASDASFLNSIGIETYCLGDGVEFAHCTDERIKIESFYLLQKVISRLMTEF